MRAVRLVATLLFLSGCNSPPAMQSDGGADVHDARADVQDGGGVDSSDTGTGNYDSGSDSQDSAWTCLPDGTAPSHAALDLNGDGYSDFVVADSNYNQAAYVFFGRSDGVEAGARLSGGFGNYYGFQILRAGDINHDAYGDVLFNSGGRVLTYAYYGGTCGLDASRYSGLPELWGSYAPVAAGGDINGDGFDDVVRASQIYFGSATGLATAGVPLTDRSPNTETMAGDVNGDGRTDVLVSFSTPLSAWLYLGSAAGVSATPVSVGLPNSVTQIQSGFARAGDLNGDGYDDFVISDEGLSPNAVFVYYGNAGASFATSAAVATPAVAAWIGRPKAAGDLNADGFDDLLVGAAGSAAAYVYYGSAVGLSATGAALGPLTDPNVRFSMAGVGDVNGDGFADVVLGAGSALYLYLGGPAGLTGAPIVIPAPITGFNIVGLA